MDDGRSRPSQRPRLYTLHDAIAACGHPSTRSVDQLLTVTNSERAAARLLAPNLLSCEECHRLAGAAATAHGRSEHKALTRRKAVANALAQAA